MKTTSLGELHAIWATRVYPKYPVLGTLNYIILMKFSTNLTLKESRLPLRGNYRQNPKNTFPLFEINLIFSNLLSDRVLKTFIFHEIQGWAERLEPYKPYQV